MWLRHTIYVHIRTTLQWIWANRIRSITFEKTHFTMVGNISSFDAWGLQLIYETLFILERRDKPWKVIWNEIRVECRAQKDLIHTKVLKMIQLIVLIDKYHVYPKLNLRVHPWSITLTLPSNSQITNELDCGKRTQLPS